MTEPRESKTSSASARGALPVFVVHWKSPTSLTETVRALRAQTTPLRITVLDNASPPDIVDQLRNRDFELELLPRNMGYGGALNTGLARWLASDDTPYAVICPHDALPRPDCVERIIDAMESRPRAGIGCAEFGRDSLPGYRLLQGPNVYPKRRGQGWMACDFPNGTLFVVARACMKDIGLFDERYFAYGDEYYIGLRALRGGWEVGQVWGAIVVNPLRVASSEITWYLNLRNGLLASYERDGLPAAVVRTCVITANGLLRSVRRRPVELEPPLALRMRAVRDFWTRRFGPPDLT